MRNDEQCKVLCRIESLTAAQAKAFSSKIADDYKVNMCVDLDVYSGSAADTRDQPSYDWKLASAVAGSSTSVREAVSSVWGGRKQHSRKAVAQLFSHILRCLTAAFNLRKHHGTTEGLARGKPSQRLPFQLARWHHRQQQINADA